MFEPLPFLSDMICVVSPLWTSNGTDGLVIPIPTFPLESTLILSEPPVLILISSSASIFISSSALIVKSAKLGLSEDEIKVLWVGEKFIPCDFSK